MITFVIPLGGGSNWENNELKILLRSIDTNFNKNIPRNIVILSNQKQPEWLTNVEWVHVERYYPGNALKHFNGTMHFENYYDTLNKIRLCYELESVSEDFVYLYDDNVLNEYSTFNDINIRVSMYDISNHLERYMNNRSKWNATVKESISILRAEGKPIYDYESHLPVVFNKSKIKELFKRFKLDNLLIPFAPKTLYFNLYFDTPDVNLEFDTNYYKAGFYNTNFNDVASYNCSSTSSIETSVMNKMWINYNDNALNFEVFKEYLFNRFPTTSKYEK
jgi:hypothetical protein